MKGGIDYNLRNVFWPTAVSPWLKNCSIIISSVCNFCLTFYSYLRTYMIILKYFYLPYYLMLVREWF